MTMMPPPGAAAFGGPMPQRGAFATSEVLPKMAAASSEMTRLRQEWAALRDKAAMAKAHAKKTRADLIVYLRVWGLEDHGIGPIKTSAERQEWADADSDVQQAELDADLAQSAAMNARAALDHAEEYFGSLRSMLGIERDENNAERGPQ